MNKDKWHKRFFDLAKYIAKWSEDPSTQVGAVIVSSDKHIVSTGYNGLPTRVKNKEDRWVRPDKYMYVEHAERNAIYQAARYGKSVKGCILYTTMYPCADCMRAIIQSGIKEIYTEEFFAPRAKKWEKSWEAARDMAEEAGLTIFEYCKE
jgi:dCMP deaminase